MTPEEMRALRQKIIGALDRLDAVRAIDPAEEDDTTILMEIDGHDIALSIELL